MRVGLLPWRRKKGKQYRLEWDAQDLEACGLEMPYMNFETIE